MITTSAHDPVHWLSINLEFGGLDYEPAEPLLRKCGSTSLSRLKKFPELVMFTGDSPDFIFFQEGRTYDRNGDELMLYTERLLRRAGVGVYRAFLAQSPHNDLHQLVYINTARVDAVHNWRFDPDHGLRRHGWVEVIVDGDEDRSIMLKSDHWDPRDGDARLAYAKFTVGAIDKGQRAIRAGDYNSITSCRSAEEGEPQRNFLAQEPVDRFQKGVWPPTKPSGDTDPDTRALDFLINIGWVDQHIADNNTTPTIHTNINRGGELIIDRCLTYGDVVTVPDSVKVDTKQWNVTDHCGVAGAVLMA